MTCYVQSCTCCGEVIPGTQIDALKGRRVGDGSKYRRLQICDDCYDLFLATARAEATTKERKRCAKVCEDLADKLWKDSRGHDTDTRRRWEDKETTARSCADRIRQGEGG